MDGRTLRCHDPCVTGTGQSGEPGSDHRVPVQLYRIFPDFRAVQPLHTASDSPQTGVQAQCEKSAAKERAEA